MTRSRTWVAYLAGIVACATLPALCIVAWIFFASENEYLKGYLPRMFGFGFLVALPHAVLLGAPYTAWLRRRGRFGVLPMVIGGFLAGVLPVMMVSIGGSLLRGDGQTLDWIFRQHKDLLLFATLGATGAMAFYGAFHAALPASTTTAG